MRKCHKTYCVVAGASGGHLVPALVVARAWKKDNPKGKVLLFSTTKSIDKRVAQDFTFIDNVVKMTLLPFSKRPDKFIACVFTAAVAFFRAFITFMRCRPVEIISTGSLISVPVAYAAKFFGIPLVLYELNAVPGRATRTLAPGAREIRMPFASAVAYFRKMMPSATRRCKQVPYPIKFSDDIAEFPKARLIGKINDQIVESYVLEGKPPRFQLARKTIFVFGGSQGSRKLNDFMRRMVKLRQNCSSKIQVIHQIGDESASRWMRRYQKFAIPAFVFDYTDMIKECYQLSDLVVCRGGAGSLFELAATKSRAIVVPLEGAEGHQILNAREMVRQYPDLFSIARQEEFDGGPKKMATKIFSMLGLLESEVVITPARRASLINTPSEKYDRARS